MKLTVVIGAATPPGRLSAAARLLADSAAADAEIVDLSATAIDVCDGRPLEQCSPATQAAVATIGAADAVVLCSPTYRASYPGVLKNLLDQLPLEALRGKPVGIVAMGTSDHHYLGVDRQLRDVLAWFGALVAPVSVYLTDGDFDEQRRLAPERAEELQQLAAGVLALAKALGGAEPGPAPLAGRRP
jgi:FMN reductase